jgi:hypothetical protein
METNMEFFRHTIRFRHVGLSRKVFRHVTVTQWPTIDPKAEMAKWCGGRVEIVTVRTVQEIR